MKVYGPYADQVRNVRFIQKNLENREGRNSILELWKQYYQCDFLKLLVIRKRQGISSFRKLIPAIFLLAILGNFVTSVITGRLGIMAVVLSPCMLASVLAALVTGSRIKSIQILPVVFACTHIANGVRLFAGCGAGKRFDQTMPQFRVQRI